MEKSILIIFLVFIVSVFLLTAGCVNVPSPADDPVVGVWNETMEDEIFSVLTVNPDSTAIISLYISDGTKVSDINYTWKNTGYEYQFTGDGEWNKMNIKIDASHEYLTDENGYVLKKNISDNADVVS